MYSVRPVIWIVSFKLHQDYYFFFLLCFSIKIRWEGGEDDLKDFTWFLLAIFKAKRTKLKSTKF